MNGNLKPWLTVKQPSGRYWWYVCLLTILTSGALNVDPLRFLNFAGHSAGGFDRADVAVAAELLNRPTLKSGSTGTEVRELQSTLTLLGYYGGRVDGVYGETTAIAVSQFQQAAGLPPDGITGPATWNRLFPPAPVAVSTPAPTGKPNRPTVPAATPQPKPNPPSGTPTAAARPAPTPKPAPTKPAPAESASPAPEVAAFPILRLGMKGPAVTGLQYRLRAIGVLKGAADGVFGPETQEAVKAAQRKFNLTADGVVGPATWVGLLQ